jgi:hypothetical protein
MAKNLRLQVAPNPSDEAQSQPTEPTTATPTPGKPVRIKPSRVLPTNRISFPKQLELLRGFAAESGPTKKPVTVDEAGKLAGMVGSTVTLANPFFLDVGFLTKHEQKGEAWKFVPSEAVFEFKRQYEWQPEKASQKLVSIVGRSWFADALMPRLSMSPISEDDAITLLAEKATAAPEYKSNLRILIEYLAAAGVVERENGQIRLSRNADLTPPAKQPEVGRVEPAQQPETPALNPALSTGFIQPRPGAMNFHIDVSVDLSEIAEWSADRITAFFSGVAMVLHAKGQLEQKASKE